MAASEDGSALVGAPWTGGAKQASAADRRHCHMGQSVDRLAMLPGRWGLVRTMEIRCRRASDGSKLMVLGDSTKAVVGWMIDGDGFLLRPNTLVGPYDFPCPK